MEMQRAIGFFKKKKTIVPIASKKPAIRVG
jgi:hypothetical protein